MQLQKELLRETVNAGDGTVAVIVNLAYPTAKGKKYKTFCAFYRKVAEAFREFARTELKAKAAKNPPGTPPCGAVLRFEAAEEKEGVIYAETDDIATITIIVILEIPASTAASPKIKDPTSPAASPTVRGILTPTSLISSNKTSINNISQNIDIAEFSSNECINSKSFFGKV